MSETPVQVVPDELHAREVADTFRLLSDPTRVRILWALLHGELNVGTLADLVDANPTAVSQHLSKLRLAGLVQTRREGTFVHYSADDAHVRRLLTEALSHAEHTTGTASADGHEHRYRS
ncbi:ArsR/SmtB family transcription factor [Ornithinimicrobium cerasi]|uniref:DNA-binding transcriptional regulator, ArsR family n=1 Tax=Ornithinimicrobium cerasi TaxID=2248773 RepID=A0A285VV54_9MICO|nr:metalloregulator ArsR/SmtB family transcription factor [Ornithinimicrobium cerasi]SOC57912.1 DNA-binding transcriptional regulator, ArsR family [Ornithinimicrobium cerasi]